LTRLTPLLLAACVALALVPAAAHALTKHQIFGIGDIKDPAAFTDKHLRALHPTAARLVVDWNIARTPGPLRDRVDAWYQGALKAGMKPLLTFEGFKASDAPSVAQYTNAFGAALKRWPRVRDWQAWNEANHIGEPVTYSHPARAAGYAKAMERRCPRCTVVPLTYVLSDSPRSARWLRTFLKVYGHTPKIWALHTYGDPNHFNYRFLSAFLRAHRTGHVWITETGGLAKLFGLLDYNLARQKRATHFAFKEAVRFRSRVDRMYYWGWTGTAKPRTVTWDSGLLTFQGRPRPAYYAALSERFKRR
jgi:hypothetical protein